MIHVMQDIYAPPRGNCFSACVASILEIDDLERVPNYLGPTWWTRGWDPWLAARGYVADWIQPVGEDGSPVKGNMSPLMVAEYVQDYFIGAGPSPRGNFNHAVVFGPDGGVAWDPYPGGRGDILELHAAVAFWAFGGAA